MKKVIYLFLVFVIATAANPKEVCAQNVVEVRQLIESLEVGVEIRAGELGFIVAVVQDSVAPDLVGKLRRNLFHKRPMLTGEGQRDSESFLSRAHGRCLRPDATLGLGCTALCPSCDRWLQTIRETYGRKWHWPS